MKKLVLLTLLFGLFGMSANAQTAAQTSASKNPAKMNAAELRKKLKEDVMTLFSLTEAQATKVISIKEMGVNVRNNPNAFRKQTEKGIETDLVALEGTKAKELSQINEIVNDAEKAKKLDLYIETNLQKAAFAGPRPR